METPVGIVHGITSAFRLSGVLPNKKSRDSKPTENTSWLVDSLLTVYFLLAPVCGKSI